MSFLFYELRLIEIKERGIVVTAKAYSGKLPTAEAYGTISVSHWFLKH